MKFQELKRIADIKEQFELIKQKNVVTVEKVSPVIEGAKRELSTRIFNEFRLFFQDQGFDIEQQEESAQAVYKSINIQLTLQNPGRRQDDVPCFLRLLLRITGSRDELYTIFVCHEEESRPESEQLTTAGSKEETILQGVLREFRLQSAQLERLSTKIEETLPDIKEEGNIQVVKTIQDSISALKMSVDSCKEEIHEGRETLLVSYSNNERNPSEMAKFESMYAFLQSLSQA